MGSADSSNIFSFEFTDGIHLIEANAGTGKTFSIEVIYLKALVELKLEVHQILLVTYTKAVTAQMKQRILEAVQTAYDYLDSNCTTSTPFKFLLDSLLAKQDEAKNLLYRALVNFNENVIFSIHGFAMQMNSEFFIESSLGQSSTLDNELTTKAQKDIIHSFWIKNILQDTPEAEFFYNFFQKAEKTAYQRFFSALVTKREFINACFSTAKATKPSLLASYQQLVKNFLLDDLLTLATTIKAKGIKTKQISALKRNFVAAHQSLVNKEIIYNNKCFKYFIGWITELEECGAELFLKENTALQSLRLCMNAEKQLIEYYRQEFLFFADDELQIYREQKQVYSYDDIIYYFYKLSNIIQSTKFPLVIIDEFQDTDWIQSRTFLQLFQKQKTKMILVGDPKQTIFGFRGGDVFAYLTMKKEFIKKNLYKLDKNWRSQREIVENVNLLFRQDNSLLIPDIEYFPSQSVLDSKEGVYKDAKQQNVWNIWDFSDSQKKPVIEDAVLTHLASKVASLVTDGKSGSLQIGSKPLEPQDICILVPNNKDVLQVKNYLARAGLSATAKVRFSIGQTPEFQNWWHLLQAVLEHKNKQLISSVLISNFFTYDLTQIQKLDDAKWKAIFQDFASFYALWQTQGFVAMAEKITTKMRIIEHLLPQGHRVVTNFYQSLNWFLTRDLARGYKTKNKPENEFRIFSEYIAYLSEDDELQLASDKNTVQIMTIHKSKGLEFPIVFCPYLWTKKRCVAKSDFFHLKKNFIKENQQTNQKMLFYDISVDNIYKDQIAQEQEAEARRLLYVTLTRAKHQIHLYTSSSYKISQHKEYCAFQTLFSQLKQGKYKSELAKISQEQTFVAPPFQKLSYLSQAQTMLEVQERKRIYFPQKKNYSFSSLKNISQYKFLDQDLLAQRVAKPIVVGAQPLRFASLEATLRALPSSIAVGNLFHQILEFWVAEDKDLAELEVFISKNIIKTSLDTSWISVLIKTCQSIVQHPLPLVNDSVCLSQIAHQNIVKEMEFCLLLSKKELVAKITALYKDNPNNQILKSNYYFLTQTKLSESYLEDICVGFIDLVFFHQNKYYILDWKSNNLGKEENYHQENLLQTMQTYDYFLQYLIYYLALEKFLQVKQSKFNIGGVFYIFIRGLAANDSSRGVFFDSMDYMHLK